MKEDMTGDFIRGLEMKREDSCVKSQHQETITGKEMWSKIGCPTSVSFS